MMESAVAAASPCVTASPHCQAMRNLLGETVICTLDDGRTATGSLVCVDRLKNIILTNVIEERWVDSSVYAPPPNSTTRTPTKLQIVRVKRELSQAMIPGKHLVKVQVRKSLYEQRVAPTMLVSESPQEELIEATCRHVE